MKEELYRWYVVERKTLREIGILLGVSHETVRAFLQDYNITLRFRGRKPESKAEISS